MTEPGSVSIVGFAGCTSLGYSLDATLCAMGAGLTNFADSGLMNLYGTPVAAGALLEPQMPRGDRLATLARVGLVDLRRLLAMAAVDRVPFMVGIAPDLHDDELQALKGELDDSGVVRSSVAWYPYGRASSLLALAHAVDLVGRGVHRFIVVGGVDSLCALDTLRGLIVSERVLGPHVEGTIPAEAAAFALIARSNDSAVNPSNAVRIDLVTQGKSAMPFLNADRVIADGLAAAFRKLRMAGMRRVDRVVAAHSGEGYFGRVFSHAYLREVEIMPEPLRVDLTADSVGDVGAATGIVALAFAAYLMASESGDHDSRALAYSESDTGEIGVAVIEGALTTWQYSPNPAA